MPDPRTAARRSATLPLLSAPQIRIDQLSGLRTILAPGRAARPDQFGAAASSREGEGSAAKVESCPFCEGREERTPPELYALRPDGGAADTPGWRTRVVPNLYPALGDPGDDAGGADGARNHTGREPGPKPAPSPPPATRCSPRGAPGNRTCSARGRRAAPTRC